MCKSKRTDHEMDTWLDLLEGKSDTANPTLRKEIAATRLAILAQDKKPQADKWVLNQVLQQLKQEELLKPQVPVKSSLSFLSRKSGWAFSGLAIFSCFLVIGLLPYLIPLESSQPVRFKSSALIPQTIQVKQPYLWAKQLQQQLAQHQINSQLQSNDWLARWQLFLIQKNWQVSFADNKSYLLSSDILPQPIPIDLQQLFENKAILLHPSNGLSLQLKK